MSPEQEQAIIAKRRQEYETAKRRAEVIRGELTSIGNRLVTSEEQADGIT